MSYPVAGARIQDETERKKIVICSQRAYEIPKDVADELEAVSGEAAAYRFNVGGTWFTGSAWTACDKAIKDAGVTAAIEPLYAHPPASAGMVMPDEFKAWIEREIPPGTIISNPAWWAQKIWRAAAKGRP